MTPPLPMVPERAAPLPWRPGLGWLAALALSTVVLLAGRGWLDKAHIALAYLLLVLGASARAGRTVGLAVAVSAFLCFNWFFVPPYHTLVVAEPLDWLVLVAFLVTSGVAAQLLARARSEATAARHRAAEIDRLSAVGAEALNAGRAEAALEGVAQVIRATLDVARCEIWTAEGAGRVRLIAESGALPPAAEDEGWPGTDADAAPEYGVPTEGQLVEWVAANGRLLFQRADGATRVSPADADDGALAALDLADASTLLLPLRGHDRTAGVLRLRHDRAMQLDGPRRRFLEALVFYAALGVERVRLVAEAEHADALRRADAMKDAVLASVSHDLRTPLTTIKALAHDIGADGDERAVMIEEEADRLNRLVADLLDLSQITSGALTVTPEVNAVDDLLGAALQRVSGALRGRRLEVRMDEAEPLLLARFDFVHALRALVNLVENALKYSPPGGTVELTARRTGGVVALEVADRGPGVPPAERDRIFDRFYRPAGGPPDAGGAGLGLSIARQLAASQGGDVTFAPRAGGGSRFTLSLPAAELDDVAGASQARHGPADRRDPHEPL